MRARRVRVEVRNESAYKGIVRRDVLARIAERVLAGERFRGRAVVSVLCCDDGAIRTLNREFRKIDQPTDVLSFEQDATIDGERLLGDIAISLETVARRNDAIAATMRDEVRLLFCHGLLHLLGYDHGTPEARQTMIWKQATYLGISEAAAWLGRVS